MGGLRTRMRESLVAFRDVAASRAMRRLQLAYAGSTTLYWAASVGTGVYAFQRGGATAVGIQLVVRMVPSGLVAPFSATLADRYDRARVMVAADLLRVAIALAMAATV